MEELLRSRIRKSALCRLLKVNLSGPDALVGLHSGRKRRAAFWALILSGK